jgi:hypothetical protein
MLARPRDDYRKELLMPRTCTVCGHPQRAEIDRTIVSGASNRVISRQFGGSHDAVRRHRAHLSQRLIKAQAARDGREARSLLDQMEAQYQHARDVCDRVIPKEGRLRAFEAIAALREGRKTLMAIARLTGELRSDTHVQVNIVQSPECLALQELILQALRPFPEAQAAVVAALQAALQPANDA